MSSVKSREKRSARDFGEEHKIVVVKDEAEELLPGWTTEVKIRKTGSATNKVDRYYTDPVTGYIFNSLKDVQRYLKTGELGRLARKPKDNTCLDKDNEDKSHKTLHMEGYRKRSRSSERSKSELPRRASKRLAGISIDALLRLPSEPKTRQATRLAGIIINPSSLSLPEPKKRQPARVTGMEYDASPSVPGSKTRQAARLAGIEVDVSAASPPEPKTRLAKQQAGIKVDASTLSPLGSKTRQATRLAGIEVDASAVSPPEPKTRLAKRQAGIKVDASTSSPLEPKTRQATRQAGIKVDASVLSSPEPKTRQATRQARVRVDASVLSSPEPKTRQARRLAGMETVALPQSLPEPKTRKATRLAGLEFDALPPSLPEPKARQARRLAGMESGALPPSLPPEGKTHQATQPTGMEIDASPPSLPERKTRGARQSGIRVGASPSEPRTTRQATARRVREAEARNTTFDSATLKENDKKFKAEKSTFREMQVECVEEITDKNDGNVGKPEYRKESSSLVPPVGQESHDNKANKLEVKAAEKQELFVVSPPATPSIPKEHYKEIKTGHMALPRATYATTTEEPPPPTVVPPVNQEPAVVNHPLSNPVSQDSYGGGDMKPGSSMNFSMNDLWTDPCIDFAVKTLTGAIPCGDLNKANNFPPSSPLEVPLEELWTDPCIEFAVKTLTGAIPVREDYLQHQPASTSDPRSVHSFSLPDIGKNFCQTEVLSKHYETTPHNKQQDLAVQTVGNGSLQVPGSSNNVGVRQGSNGQCSRPRLF